MDWRYALSSPLGEARVAAVDMRAELGNGLASQAIAPPTPDGAPTNGNASILERDDPEIVLDFLRSGQFDEQLAEIADRAVRRSV
jgi:hypothetical protein